MSKDWERTDYIEEDVRRHSEELRALTKITQENATALKALLKEIERERTETVKFSARLERELDQRAEIYKDHETRLRRIESWKSVSGAYWTVLAAAVAAVSSVLLNQVAPRLGM